MSLHCGNPDCTLNGHTEECDMESALDEAMEEDHLLQVQEIRKNEAYLQRLASEAEYERDVYRRFAGLPDIGEG